VVPKGGLSSLPQPGGTGRTDESVDSAVEHFVECLTTDVQVWLREAGPKQKQSVQLIRPGRQWKSAFYFCSATVTKQDEGRSLRKRKCYGTG